MPPVDPMLVLCLGNPGPRYLPTRHNVGFMVADELARRAGRGFTPGRGEYWKSEIAVAGQELTLVKPVTFMNNSGLAARQALEWYGLNPEALLVVLDDIALPLGSLRVRASGSDGGHNGLGSVIATLGTDRIARLRCGIRPEAPGARRPVQAVPSLARNWTGRSSSGRRLSRLMGAWLRLVTTKSGADISAFPVFWYSSQSV